MSLNLNIDIKKLYKQLCPQCKDKVVKLCSIQPTEATIKKVLEGK